MIASHAVHSRTVTSLTGWAQTVTERTGVSFREHDIGTGAVRSDHGQQLVHLCVRFTMFTLVRTNNKSIAFLALHNTRQLPAYRLSRWHDSCQTFH